MEFYSDSDVPWRYQRDEIKNVIIENGVTNIGNHAFASCSKLTSITIPNSVKSIGEYAFYSCIGLTSITIPNSVTSIGKAAFYSCIGLTSITIPNSVTSIGRSAFYSCYKLTSITIPNSVTNIEDDTFSKCSRLTSVTIPNSVTSIGRYAFYECSALTSITIPNSVTSIGDRAFVECSGLKRIFNSSSISLLKGSSDYGYIAYYADAVYNNVSIDGDFRIYKDSEGNIFVCDYIGSNKCITIPNNVYGIAEFAFCGCRSLTSITIPNNVKSIGGYAFKDCSGLTSITIPNGVTRIEDNTFYGCKFNTLIIGTDVTNIGKKLFGNCSNPTKTIWLSNTPPSGYANASGSINYVSNDNYPDLKNTKVYKHLSSMFEVNGIKYVPVSPSERTCDAIDCIYDETTENVKIDDIVSYKNIEMTVLNINPYAFYGNEFIRNLNINYNGKIDDHTFEECINITNATLGNKITSICHYAFSGCVNIKSINITDLITEIKKYAFANCSSLTRISIPKMVTSVGDYAFSGCKSLADVTIEDRTESISLGSNGSSPLFSDCPINSVYLGGKLSYNTSSKSGYSPFYRNKDLQSVVIADTEEQIYDNEFYGCTNLKSVKIGDGVKSIGKWAFSGCASLESFSFGKSMQSIGQEAFSDCTNMKSITSYAATAPECGSQALDDIDKWSCVLSVPYSSLASYQNAEQWKEFFFIQETEPDEQTIANAVIAKINSIGKVEYTDACKDKIDEANNAYNALTADQKALVSNLDVLTTAQQTYDNLKAAADKLAADKAKANAVVAKINAIGKVEYTEACKGKIDAASKAYEALTADQKALVTNIDVLTTAQQTYDNLKAAADKLAADKAKANAVVAKINAIGKVEYTDACKNKIDEANNAYNALTADQKALVTNLDVLTTAQQTYDNLKAAADKLAADKTAFDKYKSEQKAIIEALIKDDDSDAVKDIIKKAISDIDALGYEEAISLDDNKVNINSFVTSVNEAVEKQRAEDERTTGIEELEFAEKANIYDLNGRKITNSMLKSGLYIRNGKKVVVK